MWSIRIPTFRVCRGMKFTRTIPSFYLQEEWAAPPGVGAYTLTCTLDPSLPRPALPAGGWAAGGDTGLSVPRSSVLWAQTKRSAALLTCRAACPFLGCSNHLTSAPWDRPLLRHRQPCLYVSLQLAACPFAGRFPDSRLLCVSRWATTIALNPSWPFLMRWKEGWDGRRMLSPDPQNLRLHLGSA